jgi:hypothetical protein
MLLTALSEALGMLAHPGGAVGVTLPMLSVAQVGAYVQQWADRGWLEVLTPGENPTLQLGAPIGGAVMSFLAWTSMIVLHDVQVVELTSSGPSAHEELLLFVVTGPVIWAFVTQGLTAATGDVGDVDFRMQSVTAEQGVEAVARFMKPNDVTLPDGVYAPATPAAAAEPEPVVVAAAVSPPAPAPAPAPAWSPSHVVPTGGLPAWNVPDASQAPAATLDASLDVQLVELQPNGWGHVVCSNGWAAWVDGRLLVPR